jgi:hypothetical protein
VGHIGSLIFISKYIPYTVGKNLQNARKNVTPSNANWVSLAARVVRCILAKKDIGYGELARRLAQYGHTEDERALATRVSLGRVRLSLLLQIFCVADADFPVLWRALQVAGESWEAKAVLVFREEMGQTFPMNMDELAEKMIALGAGFKKKTLIAHIKEGNLFLPDFLKCLFILRSHSLDGCIDYKDVVAVAEAELSGQNNKRKN